MDAPKDPPSFEISLFREALLILELKQESKF